MPESSKGIKEWVLKCNKTKKTIVPKEKQRKGKA